MAMTKADLLNTLNAVFFRVGDEVAQPEIVAGLTTYTVRVYELDAPAESVTFQNIEFVVDDEGGGGEVAFWVADEPIPALIAFLFSFDLQVYITGKIVDTTFSSVFELEEDFINETAIGIAIMESGPNSSEVKILFRRDGGGDIEHIEVDNLL